ncbi:ankyrin [Corynebacterium phocae]|uniref:Ankyrin n=1 Tax=Corynebacterium phocae TaxID=161895 RepID=A0A1L7D1V8_9CORY|nr:ankyrin repeat domain-containing protein [Corynebacterium phocae]APT92088.1 ankyrin [Corynebacterium phocae]KAA8726472.1 ankyrin repeat domain-containing protein [Corynebacterium phocae]
MTDIEQLATKLFDFARAGDRALLSYVEQGVNVNLVNQDGQSFLMLAAYNGHVDLVHGLLAAGADVNLLNDRGQSPLAGVIFKGDDALVDVLLTAGADPQAGTPSALDTARMFGREDLVSRLG